MTLGALGTSESAPHFTRPPTDVQAVSPPWSSVEPFEVGVSKRLLLTLLFLTDPRTFTNAPRTEDELDGLSSAQRRLTMLSEAALPQYNEEATHARELELARWNMEQFFARDDAEQSWHSFYNDVHRAQMRLVSLSQDIMDEVSLLVSGITPSRMPNVANLLLVGVSGSAFARSLADHFLRTCLLLIGGGQKPKSA